LLGLIQTFVSYARSHELPDNAALAVTQALQGAFPCKARQGSSGHMRLDRHGAAVGSGTLSADPVRSLT